jgi:hypothetical protein
MRKPKPFLTAALLTLAAASALAIERPNVVYKIFQFPADKILVSVGRRPVT